MLLPGQFGVRGMHEPSTAPAVFPQSLVDGNTAPCSDHFSSVLLGLVQMITRLMDPSPYQMMAAGQLTKPPKGEFFCSFCFSEEFELLLFRKISDLV